MRNTIKQRGFTLLELLVTIAIVGIMSAIAYPSMARFIENTRIVNRSEQIANLFRFSRSEAVRMNTPVIICGVNIRSDGRPSGVCNVNNISNGLMSFADRNRNGTYEADSDVPLRTIPINGNNPNNNLMLARDACPLLANNCATTINSGEYIFLPNGMFGFKNIANTNASNLMSNVTIAQHYVRFILSTNNGPQRLTVISPNGNATVCQNGSGDYQTYENNNQLAKRICTPS